MRPQLNWPTFKVLCFVENKTPRHPEHAFPIVNHERLQHHVVVMLFLRKSELDFREILKKEPVGSLKRLGQHENGLKHAAKATI